MDILIVEDNALIRRSLISSINASAYGDHRFFECTTEDEAVRLYRLHRPDCVLMDIQLDRGDGLDATRRIVAVNPEARIIILTMYDYPEYRDAAKSAGASAFILKDHMHDVPETIAHVTRQ